MPVINPAAAPLEPVPPTENTCGWSLDTTCVPGWADLPLAVREISAARAVEILWALSGRRFGNCPVTWRPCSPRCQGASGYRTWPVGLSATSSAGGPWMWPYISNGVWRNCICPGPCSCGARCEVPFPTPVASVVAVKVDGVTLTADAYRLDSFNGLPYLVRVDADCWPQCQDMNKADTETGTFAVDYVPGEPLSVAGAAAAGALAGEFAKACQGADCRLPDQLVSLSRNGVEVQVADPQVLLDAGLTGVEEVDLWIRSVNPARKAQPSKVYSPDVRRGRFTA